MLELISLLCALLICVLTPIEVIRIRGGWVRKRFAGDRDKFLAAYRKQLTVLTVLGLVFGAIWLVLGALETHGAEALVKFVGAAIWLAVAIICSVMRPLLPKPITA